jgi:hypothetical protein
MSAGKKSVRLSPTHLSLCEGLIFILRTSQIFLPMTNLCIVRVAGGVAASLTGEALMLLDRVCGGSAGEAEGHEVALSCVFIDSSPNLVFPSKL